MMQTNDARHDREPAEIFSASVLDEVLRRIVAVARPEKIILFGSAARGQMSRHSDLDLLVVAETDSPRTVARDIYGSLRGVGIPVDVMVATPVQVERHADTNGPMLKPALEEGMVVYDSVETTSVPYYVSKRPVIGAAPDPAILEEIVDRIVEVANPDKIILFGAAARGHLLPGRDIPLLIVADAENTMDMVGRVYKHLYGVGAGVSAVVATPERVKRYRYQEGSVFKHAVDEGNVLYEAA